MAPGLGLTRGGSRGGVVARLGAMLGASVVATAEINVPMLSTDEYQSTASGAPYCTPNKGTQRGTLGVDGIGGYVIGSGAKPTAPVTWGNGGTEIANTYQQVGYASNQPVGVNKGYRTSNNYAFSGSWNYPVITIPGSDLNMDTTDCTVLMVYFDRANTNATIGTLFGLGNNNLTLVEAYASGGYSPSCYFGSGAPIPIEKKHPCKSAILITAPGGAGTTSTLHQDGKRVGTSTKASNSGVTNAPNEHVFGGRTAGGGASFLPSGMKNGFYHIVIWKRILTQIEIDAVFDWCGMLNQTHVVWFNGQSNIVRSADPSLLAAPSSLFPYSFPNPSIMEANFAANNQQLRALGSQGGATSPYYDGITNALENNFGGIETFWAEIVGRNKVQTILKLGRSGMGFAGWNLFTQAGAFDYLYDGLAQLIDQMGSQIVLDRIVGLAMETDAGSGGGAAAVGGLLALQIPYWRQAFRAPTAPTIIPQLSTDIQSVSGYTLANINTVNAALTAYAVSDNLFFTCANPCTIANGGMLSGDLHYAKNVGLIKMAQAIAAIT